VSYMSSAGNDGGHHLRAQIMICHFFLQPLRQSANRNDARSETYDFRCDRVVRRELRDALSPRRW
jgi:hypothetical protein